MAKRERFTVVIASDNLAILEKLKSDTKNSITWLANNAMREWLKPFNVPNKSNPSKGK